MYLVFNMAVLPFRVLSDNHKIHIFMSKITRRKTFVDQLMIQSQKLAYRYIHIITTPTILLMPQPV